MNSIIDLIISLFFTFFTLKIPFSTFTIPNLLFSYKILYFNILNDLLFDGQNIRIFLNNNN